MKTELTIKDWEDSKKAAQNALKQVAIDYEIWTNMLKTAEKRIKCLTGTTKKVQEKNESL